MNSIKHLFSLIVLSALVGCATDRGLRLTDTATGQVINADIDQERRLVWVRLPSGDRLNGEYRIYGSGAALAGAGLARETVEDRQWTGILKGPGPKAHALLDSDDSQLLMEMIWELPTVTGAEGAGKAQTSDGRRYDVQFR